MTSRRLATDCIHDRRPHYAKGRCKTCYLRGQNRKRAARLLGCGHVDVLAAQGRCLKCYRHDRKAGIIKTGSRSKPPCHCGGRHYALGLCRSHYEHQKRRTHCDCCPVAKEAI